MTFLKKGGWQAVEIKCHMTFIREEIELRVVPAQKQSILEDSKDDISSFLFPTTVQTSTVGPINYNQPNRIQKLQNRALVKILFEKQQDFIYQVCKELKILKLCNRLLYLQNGLFMSEIETNQKLVNSIVDFNTLQWQPQLYYLNSKQKIFLLIHKSM